MGQERRRKQVTTKKGIEKRRGMETRNDELDLFIQKYAEYPEHQSTNPLSNVDSNEQGVSTTPHYLKPTFSSTLPPYTHGEIERVTNSFRSGSCWSLKKLPASIKPGEIQYTMNQNTTSNLLPLQRDIMKITKKPPSKTAAGLFGEVVHIGTEFTKFNQLEKADKEGKRIQMESFCRKPFKVISKQVHKTEDLFGDANNYTPSILGPSSGSVDFTKVTRSDCYNSTKFLCGPFRANVGREKEKDKEAAQLWTGKIFKIIQQDWGHLRFKVKFVVNDELLIQFIINDDRTLQTHNNSLPPEGALNKYMQQIAAHGYAAEVGLKKRGDRWGLVEKAVIDENEVLLLTFSMYAPWSSKGQVNAAKKYADLSRTNGIIFAENTKNANKIVNSNKSPVNNCTATVSTATSVFS
jgi:hypothetical protein